MKKYRFYGGLFVTPLLITTSCSYLTNNVKNTNDYSPPLEQVKHAQAQLLAIHTTPDKKSSKLLRSVLLGLLCEKDKSPFDSYDLLTGIQVCF